MRKIFLALLVLLSLPISSHAQGKSSLPDTYNFKRGLEAFDNEQYADAIDYFEKELTADPKNGYAHYFLAAARASTDDDKMADVLKELNLALKYLPKKDADYRARTLGVRSRVQLELGDTARAIDDLTMASTTDVESTQALLDRADIYYEQKKFDQAQADYNECLKRDEACTQAYMGLGRNAMERKDYAEATRLFDRVLRLDPNYSRAHSFRARSLFQQKKYRESAADVISALDASDHADLASYTTMWQLADSAFVHIETQLQAKALQDNAQGVWNIHLGNLYEHVGRYHQAIAAYEKAINSDPNEQASVNFSVARAYMGLYDYPTALKYADIAVASDTTDADYLTLRGVIKYNLDQKEEAIADLNHVVALAPDAPSAYATRGWIKGLYGDREASFADYSTALTLDNDNAANHMHRARLYALLGDTAAAHRDFAEAVRLDTVPAEADAAIFAFIGLGQTDKAKAWNDSILAHSTAANMPGNLYNAACVYSLLGESDKALDYLNKAFERGYRDVVHMSYDTDMDNLRALPRYQELVARYTALYKKEILKEETAEATSATNYEQVTTEVPFTRESGIYKVKCTINDLPLHFYFDTGAADVTISSVEAAFMLKNGYLNRSDIGGKQYYGNASGDISEGTTITLRSVEFGGLTLQNVKASVVHSQSAPLLLGQTVLSRLGKIEIDYEKNVIRITHLKAK